MHPAQHNLTSLNSNQVYVIKNASVTTINTIAIASHSAAFNELNAEPLIALYLAINDGAFTSRYNAINFPVVRVMQQDDNLVLICPCSQPKNKLCEHQSKVLLQAVQKNDFRLYFDEQLRLNTFKKAAVDYGLQNELNLDEYFELQHTEHQTWVKPVDPSLFPVTINNLNALKGIILTAQQPLFEQASAVPDGQIRCIVFKKHKYYKHLIAGLYNAPLTKDGKIKNPLIPVNPLELIWQSNDPSDLKFFTAISRFQNTVDDKLTSLTLDSLKAIVKNPLGLNCYVHQNEVSEKITAPALSAVKLSRITNNVVLTVHKNSRFYEVSGSLNIGDVSYKLTDLHIVFTYFVQVSNTLYLVKDVQMLGIIQFFKHRKQDLLIHQSQYYQFKSQILHKLEETTPVKYRYIKTATPGQLQEQGFNIQSEQIIYLSDFGEHVMIVPVMRYGEVEVPIRTQKQINGVDSKGKDFVVQRNYEAELQFIALLLKQHPHFEEQLTDDLQYFYLHKNRFLNADWFLNAFEEWYQQGITILGFNEINGNRLNPNKAKVSVRVLSGINWFNTVLQVNFGKRKASLKHLHKAIRNKSKFVQLDDGTLGILPEEWIDRFTAYFGAGQVGEDDMLHTAKINFITIAQLYDAEMLDAEVSREINNYQQKLAGFEQVSDVTVPAALQTILRPYQIQGLKWLNFLDDFNFGGCLADDMGLGKTVQIIAFILQQRQKVSHNTNLLVVPTSLIFNWQAEVQKFAPSIKVHTIHGASRVKSVYDFSAFEIILTSYGTLLADVNFIKKYEFNYIFLDESQNIKNPDSQRYKAVRLLQARNRIAITGTPIENNTFDLYSQLSFACPGLLGSKQYFKDIYSSPIDKFKVNRRLSELKRKIRPFVLRRTKQEVATELPDKTEVVLHCEMNPEQRAIYDAYEKEFREFISATTQEELPSKSMYVLKGLTKLRQICDSPLLINEEKPAGNASAKIEVLMEQIQSKSLEHKILVFSQFVSMLNLIAAELKALNIDYAYLAGNTKNREDEVNRFQDNADTRVFLISLKAGGTGLNLTAADYVYLVDPWWNPAVENQAIDRAYRIGQKKNVVAVRLICLDTIEEKMIALQQSKIGLASNLIPSDGHIFQSFTRASLLALLKHP